MGCSYQIDRENGLVRMLLEGAIEARDVLGLYDGLRGDPEFRSDFDALVDMTRADLSAIPSAIVKGLSQRSSVFAEGSRRAVVAPADSAFGLGRMYEQRREGSAGQMRVFRTLEEARDWLTG